MQEKVNNARSEEKNNKNIKHSDNRNNKRKPRRMEKPKSDLEDKVISINRVTKVVKGGRQFRFSATVVVGNRKGKVGIGTGKAKEMPDAVKKATQAATKNLINVELIDNRTISHEIIMKEGAVRVMLKPATEGTGVKAGGPVRDVLELAGVKDVLSKHKMGNLMNQEGNGPYFDSNYFKENQVERNEDGTFKSFPRKK